MVMVGSSSTPASSGDTSSGSSLSRAANKVLGKDDFLKLLVTQLRYQDPMNPVQDKDFIAQMAQFSSVEQLQNMSTEFKGLRQSQEAFMGMFTQNQGSNLLGKEVTAVLDVLDKDGKQTKDKDGNIITQEVTGIVQGYKVVDGAIVLSVNGINVALERVTRINQGPQNDFQLYTQWASFIGKNISGKVAVIGSDGKLIKDEKGNTVTESVDQALVKSYKVVNGQPLFEVVYKVDGIEKRGQLLNVDSVG